MVRYLFIEAPYDGEIKLNDNALEKLSKYKSIALFSSVQFINGLNEIKQQLTDKGISVITTKAKRAKVEGQILGCDCMPDSFEDPKIFDMVEGVLYIGDGLFHPKALLLAQQDFTIKKDVCIYDPIGKVLNVLTSKEIEKQKNRYQANLVSYLGAKKVGILVSNKTGQQYLNLALELAKKNDKEYYVFVGDDFNLLDMENFNFINAWVNSACPRIGTDDIVNIRKPMVNIKDVLKS